MFNKYLLVSTLVCGLMSVSMGDDYADIENVQTDVINKRAEDNKQAGEGLGYKLVDDAYIEAVATGTNKYSEREIIDFFESQGVYDATSMQNKRTENLQNYDTLGIMLSDKTGVMPTQVTTPRKELLQTTVTSTLNKFNTMPMKK